MASIINSLPARRIVSSLLALLVLIMTLPGPRSWACMLKSGSMQCCCSRVEANGQGSRQDLGSQQQRSCCHAQDVGLTADEFSEGPQRDADDGDDGPCDCGGDAPEQPSVEPQDGGNVVLTASIPVGGVCYPWPAMGLLQVGADHETQERCTGPPLYVLYEVFVI